MLRKLLQWITTKLFRKKVDKEPEWKEVAESNIAQPPTLGQPPLFRSRSEARRWNHQHNTPGAFGYQGPIIKPKKRLARKRGNY